LFQFQYGAIGAKFVEFAVTIVRRVSIPVWCDWC